MKIYLWANDNMIISKTLKVEKKQVETFLVNNTAFGRTEKKNNRAINLPSILFLPNRRN